MEELPPIKITSEANSTDLPEPREKKFLKKSSFATMGLLILAVFYTLYFARAIFLPIIIAIILNFILSPIIRGLKRIWIPQQLSALLIILLILFCMGFGFYRLSDPASQWLNNAPANLTQATQKLTHLLPLNQSVKNFFKIQEQIEKTTATPEKNVQVVTIKQDKWVSVLFNSTWEFLLQLTLIIILLYFLLSSKDFFLRKLVEIMPGFAEKKETVLIIREIGQKISSFLFLKIITSTGLAVAISLAMLALGMPNPVLWGVMAGLLEFIPYLGVLVGTTAIAFSAALYFDTLTHILLVPLIFFAICSIQGNIIFPLVASRRMILHPVIIFIGVIFWGWIWGIPGALIGIPLISIFKIICDDIKPLNHYGKFLGEEGRVDNLNPPASDDKRK